MSVDSEKTILVTGGAGYIGSHACKALAAAGYQPVVYDSLVHGHDWAVRWGPLEIGELADQARLEDVVTRYRPSACMHFAAYAYVGESVQVPLEYYGNNFCGALALLQVLQRHGVDRLVFSSTCATYGNPRTPRLAEQHPQEPINPYGRSKLMVERCLQDLSLVSGLRFMALRYFNAAGADAGGEIGEVHQPETHLIPLALQAAARNGVPLTVYGGDYPTPDGSCIRDYIHVTDLADAHVLALRALDAGAPSAAFNLGTGTGTSVLEVLAAVERITGCPVPHRMGPRRAGDPAALVADPTRFLQRFGWQPRHSGLDNIVTTAWAWEQAVAGRS